MSLKKIKLLRNINKYRSPDKFSSRNVRFEIEIVAENNLLNFNKPKPLAQIKNQQ
jgi:hypothetical protein